MNSRVPAPRDTHSEAFASMTAEVPDTVRAALLMEVTSVSGELVAKAAAVVGDEFEPAAVAAVGQLPEAEVLTALRELVARDVVRADASRFRFRFRHPLMRHAAYASAKAGWRMGAHVRAACFLRGKGAQPQMLAHHVVKSAPFGDLASVTELASAAQAVVSWAPAAAPHWLVNALRLLPDNEATRPARCNLLLALANAQLSGGQLREGRDTAREALQLLPADDLARRAVAARLCATTERMLGSREAAKAVLSAELRKVPDPLVVEAAPLYLRLAVEYIGTGEAAECARMLAEMATLDHLDPPTAFAATALSVMPAYIAGDIPGALDMLDEVDRLMAGLSAAEITPWLDTAAWLCWAELMVGRHARALARSAGRTTPAISRGATEQVNPSPTSRSPSPGRPWSIWSYGARRTAHGARRTAHGARTPSNSQSPPVPVRTGRRSRLPRDCACVPPRHRWLRAQNEARRQRGTPAGRICQGHHDQPARQYGGTRPPDAVGRHAPTCPRCHADAGHVHHMSHQPVVRRRDHP